MAEKQADLDLALLRSFVAVVEAKGFTAASDRLNRTQSTVSQQIRKLEDLLGCVLIDRSHQGISLTAAGEQVLQYARRMLTLNSELHSFVSLQRYQVTLKLGITNHFAQTYLELLLDRLRQRYPQLRVDVVCDLSVKLRKGVARGSYDLAIYKRTAPQGKGVPILSEPMLWIAADRYVADQQDFIPLVLFHPGCVYRQRALALLEEAQKPWRISFESPSTLSIQAATRAGYGVTVLTPGAVPEGCVELVDLPELGDVELVYEFGPNPPQQIHLLLEEIMALIN